LIVVDTSVWVDFFRDDRTAEAALLDSLLPSKRIILGDLVLCEILLGVPTERAARETEAALRKFRLVTMVGDEVARKLRAAFRALRSRGITIRKTIDLLIGTWCIENGRMLLHRDRDYDAMERHLGLRVLHA
jgi:hypothetical protein